jgi:hypothetical protein
MLSTILFKMEEYSHPHSYSLEEPPRIPMLYDSLDGCAIRILQSATSIKQALSQRGKLRVVYNITPVAVEDDTF